MKSFALLALVALARAQGVTQIGDGQPQAPSVTTAPAPVTQIGDGQPQAPVTSATLTLTTVVPPPKNTTMPTIPPPPPYNAGSSLSVGSALFGLTGAFVGGYVLLA